MSFFTGLVTGLAKSVDEQLKKDMQRTQDRIDGMAQYRVTRRRAELERKEKEKDELRDTLLNLSSLVDGDIDKAAQIYKGVGGTISSANEFYKTAMASKQTMGDDFQVDKAFDFMSENAPKGVSLSKYLDNFTTGVKKIPVSDEDVPATGLYGALFKPKVGEQIMKRVDATAPLDKETEKFAVPTAKINYNEFLTYKDYQKKNKPKAASSFEGELLRLENDLYLETNNQEKSKIQARIDKVKSYIIEEANRKNKSDGKNRYWNKEKLSTLFDLKYAQNIDSKYLGEGPIEQGLKFLTTGNEVPILVGKKRALQTLNKQYGGMNDLEFKNKYMAEVMEFTKIKTNYVNTILRDQNIPPAKRTRKGIRVHTVSQQGNKTAKQVMEENIRNGMYGTGDLVNTPDGYHIVTDSGYI